MTDHTPDPHHDARGFWTCAAMLGKERCNRPLKGSYLRPVIPWEHRAEAAPATDETALPGLGTTE